MDIKLINTSSSFIDCKNKFIKNFGVSFDLEDKIFPSEKLGFTNIIINYDISLFKDRKIKFGKIQAKFNFEIPEAIKFITFDEKTKQTTLLHCLKMNHNNINDLILFTLRQNEFKTIDHDKYLSH